eukprot:9626386-Alexandrium_andersonii.AAC.1
MVTVGRTCTSSESIGVPVVTTDCEPVGARAPAAQAAAVALGPGYRPCPATGSPLETQTAGPASGALM